jgi:hypothetical protein
MKLTEHILALLLIAAALGVVLYFAPQSMSHNSDDFDPEPLEHCSAR